MKAAETAARQWKFARELEAAHQAALEAGAILERYYRERGYDIDSKGKDNPVTTADFEADARLKELLHGGFPEYGWLSEETADDGDRLRRERVWIVDPLDGTKEFIKGIPEFVVAIALTEAGSPVLGVTYNPIKRELFAGGAGFGCFVDHAPAAVSSTSTLDRATILASRSETSRGEWKAYEGSMTVRAIGSVAYKLALVAAGRADATFTLTPKSEWDIASGAALILAAGGAITDVHGDPLVFNKKSVKAPGLIASNGHLHAALEGLIGVRRKR